MSAFEERLSNNMLKLLVNSNHVFLANILLGLEREITTDTPTAAVTSSKLMLNPDFMGSLSDVDQRFVLLHEAAHIAFNDIDRSKGYNQQVHNMACDHYINLMLVSEGMVAPDGALCDPKFIGWEKKAIYDYLIEHEDEQQPDVLEGDTDQLEGSDELANVIAQAAIQTKSSGNDVPDAIEKLLEEWYRPKLKWNEILRRYMQNFKKDKCDWSRPNRRYIGTNIYLPRNRCKNLGTIGIAIDTSASVTDEEYKLFVGGIEGILSDCKPDSLEVVSFNTAIQNKWTIKKLNDIEDILFRSSGGTSLTPVFEHFNEIKPRLLIIFSDMECEPYTSKVGYDVINIIVNNISPYKGIGRNINITM